MSIWDVIADMKSRLVNSVQNPFGQQASQPSTTPAVSVPVSVPQDSVWSQFLGNRQQAPATYEQPAWSAPQAMQVGPQQQEQDTGKTKRKSESEQEDKSVAGTGDNGEQKSIFDNVMQSVMQNPDTQAILQNPLNAFVPQVAEARGGGNKVQEDIELPQTTDPWSLAMPGADAMTEERLNRANDSAMGPQTTDPWMLSMPSGEQLDQLTPAEREDWQNRTAAGLAGTAAIASLPLSTTAALGASGVAGTAGRFIPALLLGGGGAISSASIDDSSKKVAKERELAKTATEAGIAPEELIYGKTPEEISKMYEDAIYDLAMQDETYRQAFNDAGYGDLYGSYAAYGSLGDTNDYSSRRDVTRDVFGLNDEGDNALEIKGLKDIYKENGVINDDMTNEEMLEAILDAHWGAGNIIDPYQWLYDASYQQANPFAGTTAGDAYAQYWLDSGFIPALQEGSDNVFAGLGNGWDQLDNADLAALINAGNVINQANSGMQFTDQDLAALTSVFGEGFEGRGGGGDRALFAYLPEGASENEGYNSREWNGNGKSYSAQNIMQAIAEASQGNYNYLNPYLKYDLALGDSDMTDAVMAAIEANDRQQRKIGRKD